MRIPFNKTYISGNDLINIQQAFANGVVAGDGAFTTKCQALLERELGVKKALLTTSCTHALEISAILLDLQAGDEVILPSYTFVSTATAFVLHGATPIFADVKPDSFNIDESQLEQLITPKTKAIVVVHYAGVACEMNTVMAIASKHNLVVIEDNAHGLFGKYKGKYLGTIGDMATQSFHETKNISCGEGGALLINNPKFIERAEIIRQKGTNRDKFLRGQVDKYTWVDLGSSYVLSDILAAVLFSQLENKNVIQQKRHYIWQYYLTRLQEWANNNSISLPTIPAICEQTYHMFYLVMPALEIRTQFIQYLKQHGITAVFHYQPLHSSSMGIKLGGGKFSCPITKLAADRLVRLPFFNDIQPDELKFVADTVCKFTPND